MHAISCVSRKGPSYESTRLSRARAEVVGIASPARARTLPSLIFASLLLLGCASEQSIQAVSGGSFAAEGLAIATIAPPEPGSAPEDGGDALLEGVIATSHDRLLVQTPTGIVLPIFQREAYGIIELWAGDRVSFGGACFPESRVPLPAECETHGRDAFLVHPETVVEPVVT